MTTHHRLDRLARGSIYVLPVLMEVVLSCMFFVCNMRVSKEFSLDTMQIGLFFAIWGVFYMAACPAIGRFVTRANSGSMILAACAALVGTMVFMITWSDIGSMRIGMALLAIGTALFFAPFQVFMAGVDDGGAKPPTYSTGLYTLSWSTGFAIGPFVGGMLMAHLPVWLDTSDGWLCGALHAGARFLGYERMFAWQACYLVSMLALVIAAGIILVLRRFATQPAPAGSTAMRKPPAKAPADYAAMPNMAWVGWICVGLALLSLHVFRTVFTKYSDPKLGVLPVPLPEDISGMVFFIHSMVQGLTAIVLIRSRFWMYRLMPIAAFALSGIAGILCLGLGSTPDIFYLGAVLFGVYCGAFFFYLVFHAIAHPDQAAHRVSVNEGIVGVTSILAPLAGACMADMSSIRVPLVASAGIILAAAIVQAVLHRVALRGHGVRTVPVAATAAE